jgi:hypothetical protein
MFGQPHALAHGRQSTSVARTGVSTVPGNAITQGSPQRQVSGTGGKGRKRPPTV